MDAKKVGLYAIFGMAIAYLITAIGWSGAHMSQCNEKYEKRIANIDFTVSDAKYKVQNNKFKPSQLNLYSASPSFIEKTMKKLEEDLQSEPDKEKKMELTNVAIDSIGKNAKETAEAKNKVCFSKGGEGAEEVYTMKSVQKSLDNTTFSSSDIVSNVGVSEIGYIVMYCVLFVAIGLGIFATIKDNKTMMIAFSAIFGVSALILFIFNIVLMAHLVAPRNNLMKTIDDYPQKERMWGSISIQTLVMRSPFLMRNQYERFVKPDEKSLDAANKLNKEAHEEKEKSIEAVKKALEDQEKKWEKEQEEIDAETDEKKKKRRQASLDFEKKEDKKNHSEAYEFFKKEWDGETKTQGFKLFTLAFAEFSFFVISSVAGFLLFKC